MSLKNETNAEYVRKFYSLTNQSSGVKPLERGHHMKILIALTAILMACSPTPPTPTPSTPVVPSPTVPVETPTPTTPFLPGTYKADWDGVWITPKSTKVRERVPSETYTKYLVDALNLNGKRLLEMASIKDASLYCPRFFLLDRNQKMAFWVMLISSMARHESGFDYRTAYYEANVEGNPTSRGLLQVSIPSVNAGRYGCGITDSKQLHDPKTNLYCAVKVISSLVGENGYVGLELGANERSDYRGASRYFSVLRKWLYVAKEKRWIIRPARVDIVARLKKVEGCWSGQ